MGGSLKDVFSGIMSQMNQQLKKMAQEAQQAQQFTESGKPAQPLLQQHLQVQHEEYHGNSLINVYKNFIIHINKIFNEPVLTDESEIIYMYVQILSCYYIFTHRY